jgi:predicted permease
MSYLKRFYRGLYPPNRWILLALLCLVLASLLLTFIVGVGRSLLAGDNRLSDPASLVMVAISPKAHPTPFPVSPDIYELWRNDASSFESMAAEVDQTFVLPARLKSQGLEEPITVALVTPNYFSTLGLRPVWGRTFLAPDQANGRVEAIISKSLWQAAFGADKGILGKPIAINRKIYSIAGIVEDSYPANTQIWLDCPLEVSKVLDSKLLITHYYTIWGRLKKGVSQYQAEAELDALPHEGVGLREPWKPMARSLTAALLERNILTAQMIALAAIAIFLISCGNVGIILLLRVLSRERDIALHYLLGATRSRMISTALAESLGLASIVILLVLGLMPLMRHVFLKLLPEDLAARSLAFDFPLLIITMLVSTVCVICPTLLTIGVVLRRNHAHLLHDNPNFVTPGARAVHSRGMLLTCQLSIAVSLSVVAFLLFSSARSITSAKLAWNPKNCIVIKENFVGERMAESSAQARYLQKVFEKLQAVPGVRNVGATTFLPLNDGHYVVSLRVPEISGASSAGAVAAEQVSASGGYFPAAGTILLRGRPFYSNDTSTSEPVMIVDETLAKQIGNGADVLGRLIDVEGVPRKIVGICAAAQFRGIKNGGDPLIYIPLTQTHLALPFGTVIVRLDHISPGILRSIQAEVETVDSSGVVKSVEFAENIVASALHIQTVTFYTAVLLAAFGFLLSIVGIAAVVAYSIKSQQHEIGIRLALGATPAQIIRIILQTSLTYVGIGLVAGLLLANWVSHQISMLIYGVKLFNIAIYASVSGALIFCIAAVIFMEGRRLATHRILSLLRAS